MTLLAIAGVKVEATGCAAVSALVDNNGTDATVQSC
jgi:hypothetical protein